MTYPNGKFVHFQTCATAGPNVITRRKKGHNVDLDKNKRVVGTGLCFGEIRFVTINFAGKHTVGTGVLPKTWI